MRVNSGINRAFLERKFILPMVALITGGVMVWTGKLEGSIWAGMATTLVSGFYAVTGWATNRDTQKKEAELSRLESQ